jgi:hypothetical protein
LDASGRGPLRSASTLPFSRPIRAKRHGARPCPMPAGGRSPTRAAEIIDAAGGAQSLQHKGLLHRLWAERFVRERHYLQHPHRDGIDIEWMAAGHLVDSGQNFGGWRRVQRRQSLAGQVIAVIAAKGADRLQSECFITPVFVSWYVNNSAS